MTSGKNAVMRGAVVLVLITILRANSDKSAPGNSPRPADSQRAFLDAQMLHDRWAANYTHIRSSKLKVVERILSASGPGAERMVPVSHWDIIRDGARLYGRHAPSEPGSADTFAVEFASFDGNVSKIYRPGRNEGEIHEGLAGQAARYRDLVEGWMLAARQDLAHAPARQMGPHQRLINKLAEEFPEGCPDLTVKFRIAREQGKLRVLPGLEEVAGKMCHVVEMGDYERGFGDRCWLAHDCGMLVMRCVERAPNDHLKELQVQEVGRIETEAGTVWYPVVATWDVKNPSGRTFKQELRVREYVPHIKVPPDTFDIQFPPGTKVIDKVVRGK
jgi:hypothetical protein